MTRTFTTFVAPAVFATALFAGTAAEASYVPEAQRILDVVAQTGTKITHKTCTGEDAGNAGFYEIHSNDDGKVTKDELTVCDNNAKGRDYLPTIKLEAIEEKESVRLETTPVGAPAPTNKQTYIYLDETVKDKQQIMAAVFEQLTEEERSIFSAEESDVRPGKMGFICGRDSKVIFRLGYVGRKDGTHVWKRS